MMTCRNRIISLCRSLPLLAVALAAMLTLSGEPAQAHTGIHGVSAVESTAHQATSSGSDAYSMVSSVLCCQGAGGPSCQTLLNTACPARDPGQAYESLPALALPAHFIPAGMQITPPTLPPNRHSD
jgi:hypothetical protein